jgi:hypothetical protein
MSAPSILYSEPLEDRLVGKYYVFFWWGGGRGGKGGGFAEGGRAVFYGQEIPHQFSTG